MYKRKLCYDDVDFYSHNCHAHTRTRHVLTQLHNSLFVYHLENDSTIFTEKCRHSTESTFHGTLK